MEKRSFTTILLELLESKGVNQRQLAIDCNTTEATISRYLNGVHKPQVHVVISIANALNVSTDYLLGLTDISTPKESLGPELTLLLRSYNQASARDRKLVWGILEDYLKAEDKMSSAFVAQSETKSG